MVIVICSDYGGRGGNIKSDISLCIIDDFIDINFAQITHNVKLHKMRSQFNKELKNMKKTI